MKKHGLLLLMIVSATEAKAGRPGAAPQESQPKSYWDWAKEALEFDRPRTLAEIHRLYNEARAAGENVPSDVYEWVREDLARSGAWEYRVHVLESSAPDQLHNALNALGRDRWECLSLLPSDGKLVAVMKRPMKSYLQHLPVWAVLRAVQGDKK